MPVPDFADRPFSLRRTGLAAAALTLVLTGCGTPQPHRAPVEERARSSVAQAPVSSPSAPDAKPGTAEARSGFYTVRPGDTLIRIALDQGLGWRELARWNGLDNPNLIEVGQVLRVVAPGATDAAGTRPVAATAKVETKPLDTKPLDSKPMDAKASAPTSTAAAPPSVSSGPGASAAASAPAQAPAAVANEVNWAWPAPGGVVASFDEQRNNNGLSIGGKAGEPVLAAADGTVMYAGSGIRGYGNMIVIKHNDTFLSAYAHNQVLLVKEDQVVRRGQQIAQMGNTESDAVKLHFEIRRKGKPVDPARLLPPR